ncbi:alpha/beta fold hydrolase [Pseudohoeflea suaedae]|uniref:Alpha/beta fold hydrolase n=1 Tax=Pseudohoeflea suaedae TaxID=877384 RepID=A0A4R5PIN1_9HYPH|nr:alpha/beta fold hydrolase [Pseudohoeflea suaedae]TDH35097.1 alpha/beta fold hydrolase [Pseudohoeflea suaedae]
MESVEGAALPRTIEAIYSYFNGEQEFTELMRDLEAFLTVGSGQPIFSGEIDSHFRIANELARTLSPGAEFRYKMLVEGPALKLVFDRALRVVAQSESARTAYGDLGSLGISLREQFPEMHAGGSVSDIGRARTALLEQLTGPVTKAVIALFAPEPDELAAEADGEMRSFVRLPDDGGFVSLSRFHTPDVVTVTLPAANWGEHIAEMLRRSLGLSRSETEVLELMLIGRSNVEISRERQRSVDTVKSQTQSIFRKLGVASRVEAVQVIKDITSLAALSGAPPPAAVAMSRAKRDITFAHNPSVWKIEEINGREVGYVHYPAHGRAREPGRSVILFHGLLQGPELSDRTQHALRSAGYELIGISRPGYGATARAPRDGDFFRTALDDAHAVARKLRLNKPVLLGHLFGGHAAIEYAARWPDEVSGIVFCSTYFPLQIAEHLVPIGAVQKLAMSSGLTSWAAHQFIAHTGVAYLRYGGAQRYLAALSERSPADRKAMEDLDIRSLLHAGARHASISGATAFLADTAASRHDWSGLLPQIRIPTVVLHGASDPAVNPQIARLAARMIPDCRYEELENTGQQLLHMVPDKLVVALDEIREKSA